MKNIKSFNDFRSLDENHKEHSHYMFFQNLHLIKNSIEKMLSLDAEKVDELLNSHDWASDHLSTSKDDVQEVCDFMCTMLGGHEELEHEEDDEEDDDEEGEDGEEAKELED
jgi:hypothetical protein